MSPHALVWWAILVALVVVLALAAGRVRLALRELDRLKNRVDGYAGLPVVKAAARAEGHARRIEAALAQIEPLAARAQLALAVIRRGPIPPEIRTAVVRLRAEIADFRSVVRR